MDYVEAAKELFHVQRPCVFVENPQHCTECEEVEFKAQHATPDTLRLSDVGEGWANMLSFLSDLGFLYFMPAFVRHCRETNYEDGIIDRFFFALSYEGKRNSRYRASTQVQREFIYSFLTSYFETNPELIRHWAVEEDIEEAIRVWGT